MSETTAVAVATPVESAVMAQQQLNRDQVELVKRTVAKGTSDDELKLFLYTCARTGLDPLAKQIHAIKRWSSRDKREVMSIQTGIDGYRLIAERTGRYAPGQQPTYEVDGGKLVSATAYVKKLVAGTWHEVAASAYWEEYVQTDRDGHPTPTWKRMPRLMLAKCAEALALRRAFPAEMSGVYTFDEMAQAETPDRAPASGPEDQELARPPSETPACAHCGSVNVKQDPAAPEWSVCADCHKGTKRI
jgi:phage recombination protein Bet